MSDSPPSLGQLNHSQPPNQPTPNLPALPSFNHRSFQPPAAFPGFFGRCSRKIRISGLRMVEVPLDWWLKTHRLWKPQEAMARKPKKLHAEHRNRHRALRNQLNPLPSGRKPQNIWVAFPGKAPPLGCPCSDPPLKVTHFSGFHTETTTRH